MTPIALRVIKDETEYDAVVDRIDQIFDAKPGTPEHKEVEVLLAMVDSYHTRNSLLVEVEPLEVLKFVMQQQGWVLEDITPYVGGEGMAAQIMSGKKSLTPQMIQALSTHLHIPITALM